MIELDTDAKRFIFGLDQCRNAGGMIWYGKLPQEIIDLFGLSRDDITGSGFWCTGIYIQLKPQFKAEIPEWLIEQKAEEASKK